MARVSLSLKRNSKILQYRLYSLSQNKRAVRKNREFIKLIKEVEKQIKMKNEAMSLYNSLLFNYKLFAIDH
jgi:hypothetical protein